jgi:hypothetical protein
MVVAPLIGTIDLQQGYGRITMFPLSKNICNVAVAAVALTTASLAASGDALATIQCIKAPCPQDIRPNKPAPVPAILVKPATVQPAPVRPSLLNLTRPILPATTTRPQSPKIQININVPPRPENGKRPLEITPPRPNGHDIDPGFSVKPSWKEKCFTGPNSKFCYPSQEAANVAWQREQEKNRPEKPKVIYEKPKVIYVNSPAPVAPAPVAAPAPVVVPAPVAAAAAPTCLTKEYLQAGTVLFKDVCTNQWAMNSTTLPSQVVSAANRACLTKDNLQAGVVLFKDICTNEWAMNPPEQQAQAPQASPVPQVR